MNTPGLSTWWVRLGQLAGLATLALLGLFDLRFGLATGMRTDAALLILVRVGLAVATALVWLPVHRQGSRRLPMSALVLSAASLTVTFSVWLFTSTGSYVFGGSWGLAESAGLLAVVFVVARQGAPRIAPWAAALTALAVAALPLRSGTESVYVIFGLVQALAAVGAAAGGIYLRVIATRRDRTIALVRAEQRAEFARDLHDFIAHHVTGIVVQAQGARFVAEQDPQRVITALEQIERAGAETMTSMRRMVGILRNPDAPPDAPLAPLAGVAELAPLIEGHNATAGSPARLHVDGPLDGLPVEVSTSAYRVVMEG
ncbi:hypothetical protein GCM10027614_03890 [Micromonospora vulcania]